MSNPYASPNANVTDFDDNESYEPKIFSTQGRIGRLRYFAYSFIVQFVIMFFVGIAAALLLPNLGKDDSGAATFALIILYSPIILASLVMAKRRLNDLDQNGWLAILLLVPLLNLVVAIYLLFWPGTAGSNTYGPKAIPNNPWLFSFFLIPVLIGVLAAIAIPAYQDYVKRAKAAQAQQVLPQQTWQQSQ